MIVPGPEPRHLIVEPPAAERKPRKSGFGRKAELTPDRLTHALTMSNHGKTPTEAAKIML